MPCYFTPTAAPVTVFPAAPSLFEGEIFRLGVATRKRGETRAAHSLTFLHVRLRLRLLIPDGVDAPGFARRRGVLVKLSP